MTIYLIARSWQNRYQSRTDSTVEVVRDGFTIAKLTGPMEEPIAHAEKWLSTMGIVPEKLWSTRINVASKSDL